MTPNSPGPLPLLSALDAAIAAHKAANHPIDRMRLLMTTKGRTALLNALSVTHGACRPFYSVDEHYLNIPVEQYPSLEGDADWCLALLNDSGDALTHRISGSVEDMAEAQILTIQIPTREEYEAEVPRASRSWSAQIGQLVAAALEVQTQAHTPMVCEEHPHLPYPHGHVSSIPIMGCSGPGMLQPSRLRPGQLPPTRLILQVVAPTTGRSGVH